MSEQARCHCGGNVKYFGEALMASLQCERCGDRLIGVGEQFIETIYHRWEAGERTKPDKRSKSNE